MRARILTAVTFCVLCAAVLSACGGSSKSSGSGSSGGSDNGVASKSAADIVSAATQAIDTAQSVHVSGTTTQGSSPIALDLSLVSGKGGSGSMSVGGVSFNIITIGQTVYLKAGSAFWNQFGNKQAAALLKDRWLKAPISGSYAQLAQLTDMKNLFNQVLSAHGTLTKGATTTINGQKAVAVKDSSKGGTLYVATTGRPYPIEIDKAGSGGGKITFDKINQPVTLAAPAGAISVPGGA